ncbi:MAG: hypothetical protein ACT4OW_04155 [Nitrososphaerota archaeon]
MIEMDFTQPITMGDIFVLLEAIALGASAGSLIYAMHKEQKVKRRDEATNLINKYHDSEKMQYALRILDDYNLEPKEKWDHAHGYYHKENLGTILRDHKVDPIYDEGEVEIRDSFDIFLDFIGNLEPYIKSGIIKRNDFGSFQYYLDIANNDPNIKKYAEIYRFANYKIAMKLLYPT